MKIGLSSNRHKKQDGLTLLEIMVALSIGAFMLIGIISLLVSVSQSRVELRRTSDMVENGRYALQLLTDDISRAGFYGRYSAGAVGEFSEPNPCASNQVSHVLSTLFFEPDNRMPLPIYGFTQGTIPSATPACFPDVVAGTPVLIIQRSDTEPRTVANAQSLNTAHPFLQVSNCESDGPRFAIARSSEANAALTLRNSDCELERVWSYVSRSYFVASCNACNPTDEIPTLKMREMIGGSMQITPLVEGVERVAFQFGLDADRNGSPDCYVANPEDDPPASAACPANVGAGANERWQNVVAIRVGLLVRSLEPSPAWNDTQSYNIGRLDQDGNAVREGPFDDGFRRRVFSSLVVVPNIAGFRE